MRRRVERIAHLECILGFRLRARGSGEGAGNHVLLLDRVHIVLDLPVNLSVNFTFLAQFAKQLVLVSSLGILQGQVTLTLSKVNKSQLASSHTPTEQFQKVCGFLKRVVSE